MSTSIELVRKKLDEDLQAVIEKYPDSGLDIQKANEILSLYAVDGKSIKQIAQLKAIKSSIIEEIVKDVPPGKPEEKPTPPPLKVTIPPTEGLDPKVLGRLYYHAQGHQYSSVEEFIMRELLPWYGVKIKWETRMGKPLTAEALAEFFDTTAKKALRYDEAVQEMMTPE
jgi:hypothetical protein